MGLRARFLLVSLGALAAACAADEDDPFADATSADVAPPATPTAGAGTPPPTTPTPPAVVPQAGEAAPPAPMPTTMPTTPPEPVRRPVCVDDPNQVGLFGDSYVNYAVTHTFTADLQAASGQTWPVYAVPGSSMASGGIAGFIPDQFRNAIITNPNITTIVMDGGGNDILIPDTLRFPGSNQCTADVMSPTLEVCQMVVSAAIETSEKLMVEAADAGVQEVLFFFYPRLPDMAAPGANPMLEYSLPLAREACESALERTGGRLRCTFLDTIPIFDGMTGVFSTDNIHLNVMGGQVLANAVWAAMQDACIGQPSSSGCCDPAE